MLLAAGRGSRLAPLTDTLPKPLIAVGGEPLLHHHLRAFAAAGIRRLVINLHYMGERLRQAADEWAAKHAAGKEAGEVLTIHYSEEPQLLAAAGGVRLAIARGFLTEEFILVNADVLCDYALARMRLPPRGGCRLVLADNPPAHPQGDFYLRGAELCLPPAAAIAAAKEEGAAAKEVAAAGVAEEFAAGPYTYSGIGAYAPALFMPLAPGQPHDLLPLLKTAIKAGRAEGEYHRGQWHDIGTLAALAAARAEQPK